jgi:hypothetical protein
LALMVAAGLWVGTTMMAVGPENPAQSKLVELGNGHPLTPGLAELLGDVLEPGADWNDLFAADRRLKDVYDEFGNPGANGVPDLLDTYGTFRALRDAVFVLDDLSADGNDTSALLGPGLVGLGPVFPEHDLGNLYAYAAFDSNRDLIVYAGVERLTAAGSSDLTLEFNQSRFSVDGGGAIQGSRTIGDLQVHAIFTSGALSSVEIRTWDLDPVDSTHKFLSRDILSSPSPEQCNATGTACVVCNGNTVTAADWTSFDASGNSVANLTPDTFLEFGVNLGRLVGTDTSGMRFRTLQATTPEDYTAGTFERASYMQESFDNGCMEDVAGFGLNCTAEDVRIASVFNAVVLDDSCDLGTNTCVGSGNSCDDDLDCGCTSPDDTVTMTFSAEVLLGAQARHDIGIYFATDGGDALTDTCDLGTNTCVVNGGPCIEDLDCPGQCRIEILPIESTFDANSFCTAAGVPFADCCTGAGTGTCNGTYTDLDNICLDSGPNAGLCDLDLGTACASDQDCRDPSSSISAIRSRSTARTPTATVSSTWPLARAGANRARTSSVDCRHPSFSPSPERPPSANAMRRCRSRSRFPASSWSTR